MVQCNGRVRSILRVAVPLVLSSMLMLAVTSCESGPPSMVIRGMVTDATTGEPMAGVKVSDDGYGPQPQWDAIRAGERAPGGAVTDTAGKYSFLTWPEHHTIIAEADGYEPQRETLYSGHFVFNKEEDEVVIDFALTPE